MEKIGSQASQDLFVLGVLNGKKNGTYLEIGAGHPEIFSNTLSLENLGWQGVSLDRNPNTNWTRKNKLVVTDATSCDYTKILTEQNLGLSLDYLSLDIDENTNLALQRIPLDKIQFKVITIEHDWYRNKDLKLAQREILQKAGYVLVCADVKHEGYQYEDWWLSEKMAKKAKLAPVSDLEHSDIISIYKF